MKTVQHWCSSLLEISQINLSILWKSDLFLCCKLDCFAKYLSETIFFNTMIYVIHNISSRLFKKELSVKKTWYDLYRQMRCFYNHLLRQMYKRLSRQMIFYKAKGMSRVRRFFDMLMFWANYKVLAEKSVPLDVGKYNIEPESSKVLDKNVTDLFLEKKSQELHLLNDFCTCFLSRTNFCFHL